VNPLLSAQWQSDSVRGAWGQVKEALKAFSYALRRISEGGGADRPRGGQGERLDPVFKRVMVFLFLGTKGGGNRIRIVRLLKQEALNANKIGERLGLDYKTVQHHLRILEEHKVVVSSSPEGTYGALYVLAQYFERQLELIEEMWVKFGRK
jgi:DNA-binding transcriptional ArsR family regulator